MRAACCGEVGRNRWVKQDRFARVREVVRLLLDPMAVMLIIAAVVYFLLGETRDALVIRARPDTGSWC